MNINKSKGLFPVRFRQSVQPLMTLVFTGVFFLLMQGCGSNISMSPTTTTTPTPPTAAGNISGNWQASTTPTAGNALGTLSGSIDQSGGVTSAGQFTTGVLHVSSTCFASSPSVPVQGFVNSSSVSLNSFAVNQQYLGLAATLNQQGMLQTGTYTVHGGCADGSAGTFAATLYSAFTGTYAGSVTASGTSNSALSLTTTQAPDGDGAGNFDISGGAVFTGYSCFTHGTINSTSVISGSTFHLQIVTDDVQGATVSMTGTIDAAAQQVNLATYTISGGACGGQTGSGVLSRSK